MHNLTVRSLSATWVTYDDSCEVSWGPVFLSVTLQQPVLGLGWTSLSVWPLGAWGTPCPQVLSLCTAQDGSSATISQMNKWTHVQSGWMLVHKLRCSRMLTFLWFFRSAWVYRTCWIPTWWEVTFQWLLGLPHSTPPSSGHTKILKPKALKPLWNTLSFWVPLPTLRPPRV